MIAIDTNLLVYGHRSGVPEHEATRRVLRLASADYRGWGVSVSTVAEFWAVVTHPTAEGGPSPTNRARDYLQALEETGGMQIWSPGAGFASRLLEVASELGVSGVRIFDLQIALTASQNGATEIWTNDRNFVSVPGLRVRHPLQS